MLLYKRKTKKENKGCNGDVRCIEIEIEIVHVIWCSFTFSSNNARNRQSETDRLVTQFYV